MSRKSKIVKDAIRRFYHLGNRTIARHLIASHPEHFRNKKTGEVDIEVARTAVRYHTGKFGKKNREKGTGELFRDTPVKMPQTWARKRTPHELGVGLWLVLSDVHIPFHSEKAIESAIQTGIAEKVDGVFLNGDIWDAQAVSFWPQTTRNFNKEIEAMIDFLDWLSRCFQGKKIVYKPGNHEYFLPRYIISNAPELIETPVDAVEKIFGFEERNIEFLDYMQIVKAGKLPIFHGHELRYLDRTVNPARGLSMRIFSYGACSHCHSTSMHPGRNIEGVDITCHSFGCLCNLSPDYDPYNMKWNWGFGLVNVEKNGDFEVINRRILPSGKVV
jgi:predicted phosphodiesterase